MSVGEETKPFHCKKRVLFTTSAIYGIWKIWSAYGGVVLHLDGDNAAMDVFTCREQLYITRDHPVLSCVLVLAANAFACSCRTVVGCDLLVH